MQDLGTVVFFSVISSFITDTLTAFMLDGLGRFMALAGALALTLMTLWVMIQGYLILTGQSSSSLSAFVMKAAKVFVIIMVATSTTGPIFGKSILSLTAGFSDGVTHFVAGKDVTTGANKIPGAASFSVIDKNLRLMQAGLSTIKAIDTASDQALEDEKNRALMMSTVGVAGPGIVAGVLLLLNKVAMALFIGLAPLFILLLIFKQTEPMFWTWLKFGVSTLFSLAVLTFMTGLAMDMVARLAGAVLVSDLLGANSQGITSAAMQQGGLGLILSTLVITVPPLVGNFFGAQIGAFQSTSHFGSWGAESRGGGGSNGGTPSMGGGYGGVPAASGAKDATQGSIPAINHGSRATAPTTAAQSDVVKTNPMMGNAQTQQALGAGPTATTSSSSGSVSNAGIGDDSSIVNQRYKTSSAGV
jgi:type IV secretion system protein VirB6